MARKDDPRVNDEFDNKLRRAAEEIRPRAAFVSGLRRDLRAGTGQARPSTVRRLLPSLGALALLGALVAAALLLTPELVRAPESGQGIAEGTPQPGQPLIQDADGLPNGALARLGRGQIVSLDVAPDGRLAVGSTLGVCVYRDHFAPEWCREMGTPYGMGWVTFNPAGDRIALVLSDDFQTSKVVVLDAASGERLAERAFSDAVPSTNLTDSAIAWDPSGDPRLALAGIDGTVNVWDWEANANVLGPINVSDLMSKTNRSLGVDWAMDPEGRALLAAAGQQGLLVIDTKTGVEVLRQERSYESPSIGGIAALDFSPDGAWLALGDGSGASALRIAGNQVVDERHWPMRYQPRQVAFDPITGSTLAVQGTEEIAIYSLESAVEKKTPIDAFPAGFGSLAWDGGGGIYFARKDGTLGSFQNGEALVVPTQYSGWPERIAWVGESVIVSLRNEAITRWDAAKGELASVSTVGDGQNLDELAVSADGMRAAYALLGEDAVLVWDPIQNQSVARFGPVDWKAQAVFSADNTRLVTMDHTGKLAVWDAGEWRQIRAMQATPEDAQVDKLALAPNGVTAALAWYDGSALRVDLWNLESGQIEHTIALDTNAQALAFSPDSARLAVSSSGYIGIWDVASGQKMGSMGPEFYGMATSVAVQFPNSGMEALAWSPDGKRLASGGGLVTLWDVEKGLPVTAFGGHRGTVNDLAFRADGQMLASAASDGTILVWSTGAGAQPTAAPQPTATAFGVPEEPLVVTQVVTEPAPEGGVIEYEVVDGDTCAGIAYTFNLSVESIVTLNGLNEDCSNLVVGQTLKIPAATPVPDEAGAVLAQQTLVNFLDALANRDYTRAGGLYGGKLETGGRSFDDAVEMLQYACESGGYVCQAAKSIEAQNTETVEGYDFTVTYDDGSGGDLTIKGQPVFSFSLRPDAQGPYRVVNLPPRYEDSPTDQTVQGLIEAIYASENDYARFAQVMGQISTMAPDAIDAASHVAYAIGYQRQYAHLAAKTLIGMGPEVTSTTMPVLLDHLDSRTTETRTYALVSIGWAGEAASCAVGAVGLRLWDGDPYTRFAAAWALERITGEDLLGEEYAVEGDPITANQWYPDEPEGSVVRKAREWWLAEGQSVYWRPNYSLCDP